MSSVAGALALPLLVAPATASASCNDRKVTGTVVGGVGGALIGNSIAHGGGGAVLGGLGGAVLGHEVGRASCRHEHRRTESYHGSYRPSHSGYGTYQGEANQGEAYPSGAPYAQPSQQTVYYDDRAKPIYPNAGTYAATSGGSAAHAPPACGAQTASYYNDRGELVQRPVVQTCAP